jgi:hypothetical protein
VDEIYGAGNRTVFHSRYALCHRVSTNVKELDMAVTRHLKLAGFALLLAVLVGCATAGRDFSTHNVDQIRVGETTRAEIQDLFGEPWRTGLEDGKRTWTYGKYRWSAFGDAETTDLVVRFNSDGTVSSYVFNTTE